MDTDPFADLFHPEDDEEEPSEKGNEQDHGHSSVALHSDD